MMILLMLILFNGARITISENEKHLGTYNSKKTVSARSRGFHLVFKQGLFHFKRSKDQKRSKSLICDQLTSRYS